MFINGIIYCKNKWKNKILIGRVKNSNNSSLNLFRKNNFEEIPQDKITEFKLSI